MFFSPHSISCPKQPVLHIKWRHATVAWTTMNPVPMLYKLNEGQIVKLKINIKHSLPCGESRPKLSSLPAFWATINERMVKARLGNIDPKTISCIPRLSLCNLRLPPAPLPMHPRLSLCIPRWSPSRGVLAIKYFHTSTTLLFSFRCECSDYWLGRLCGLRFQSILSDFKNKSTVAKVL